MPKLRASPLWRSGLLWRCPRCGLGQLFSSYLEVRNRCQVCELDFAFAEHGDGPAVFVILIAGALVVSVAAYMELSYSPPWWVHAIFLGPLTIGLVVWLLPAFKATLIALQYRYRHDEGRWDR